MRLTSVPWAQALEHSVQEARACLEFLPLWHGGKAPIGHQPKSQHSFELCTLPRAVCGSDPGGHGRPALLAREISRVALLTLTESLPALPFSRLKATQKLAIPSSPKFYAL